MYKVIELEGGLRFAELSKLEHDGVKYIFVASLTKNPTFVFLQPGKTKGHVSIVEDKSLLQVLTEKLRQEVVEQTEKILDKIQKED